MKKVYKIRYAPVVVLAVTLVAAPLFVVLSTPNIPFKDMVFLGLWLLVGLLVLPFWKHRLKEVSEGLILDNDGLTWPDLKDGYGISLIPWSEIDHVNARSNYSHRYLQIFLKDGDFKRSVRWPFISKLMGKWIEIPLNVVQGNPGEIEDEIIKRVGHDNPSKYYGIDDRTTIGAIVGPFVLGFLGFCYWQDKSLVVDFLGRNMLTLILIGWFSFYSLLKIFTFAAQIFLASDDPGT